MAIYHLSATPIQRSKGHSAVAAAAYRAGEKLYDARRCQVEDYSRKQGVVHSEIITPDNAPDWTHDRAQLWNKAEAAERQYNGQPACEVRLALPSELTDEQRADLVFNYVNDVFVSRGMIADVSIHRPDAHGDDRNHHAHMLLTMRELDGDQFSSRKQRGWNRPELLEDWREQWADYQNRALEDAGSDARVDHRSHEDRGIDRTPTRHMGKDASAMERDGIPTRIGDENREAARQEAEFDGLKNELAAVNAEIEEIFFPTAPKPSITHDFEQEPEIDPVLASHKRDILEYGQVQETGLGRKWYDGTVTMFENMYYGVVEQARDFWQQYVMDKDRAPECDREEPEPEIW